MNNYQARGYILEAVVLELLKDSGYINVKTSTIRGRGASHHVTAAA